MRKSGMKNWERMSRKLLAAFSGMTRKLWTCYPLIIDFLKMELPTEV